MIYSGFAYKNIKLNDSPTAALLWNRVMEKLECHSFAHNRTEQMLLTSGQHECANVVSVIGQWAKCLSATSLSLT